MIAILALIVIDIYILLNTGNNQLKKTKKVDEIADLARSTISVGMMNK